MEIFIVMVPFSIILIVIAVLVFAKAVKSGQFDDLEGPAHRILYDDDQDMIPVGKESKKTEQKKSEERS